MQWSCGRSPIEVCKVGGLTQTLAVRALGSRAWRGCESNLQTAALDRLVHSNFADTFILKGGHRDQIHIPNDGTLTMKVRCRDQKVTTRNWGRVPGFAR
jgi:hypothetical protein